MTSLGGKYYSTSGQRANHRFAMSQRTPVFCPKPGVCPTGSFPKVNPRDCFQSTLQHTQLTVLSVNWLSYPTSITQNETQQGKKFTEFSVVWLSLGHCAAHCTGKELESWVWFTAPREGETVANTPSDVCILDYPHLKDRESWVTMGECQITTCGFGRIMFYHPLHFSEQTIEETSCWVTGILIPVPLLPSVLAVTAEGRVIHTVVKGAKVLARPLPLFFSFLDRVSLV